MLLIVVCSCGARPDLEPPEFKENSRHKNKIEGSIEKVIEQHYSDENNFTLDKCDISQKEIKYKIARALDKRAKEITKMAQDLPESASNYYKFVPMPPTVVRELIEVPEIKEGWQASNEGWSDIYEYYNLIKDKPMNISWFHLDSWVRGYLVDDEKRIVRRYNYSIDKDSEAPLSEMKSSVKKCIAEESCVSPKFSRATKAFALKFKMYELFIEYFKSTENDFDTKREFLEKFLNWIEFDLSSFGFVKNESLTRKGFEFNLDVDASVFNPSLTQFANYVETIWTNDTYKLKLNFVNKDEFPNVFKVLLGDQAGSRAFVNYGKKIVQLYPLVRTGSIGHEFGHVLGFSDNYYTTWHPKTCEYVTQVRENDVMSDSSAGKVTPEKWQKLLEFYPDSLVTN